MWPVYWNTSQCYNIIHTGHTLLRSLHNYKWQIHTRSLWHIHPELCHTKSGHDIFFSAISNSRLEGPLPANQSQIDCALALGNINFCLSRGPMDCHGVTLSTHPNNKSLFWNDTDNRIYWSVVFTMFTDDTVFSSRMSNKTKTWRVRWSASLLLGSQPLRYQNLYWCGTAHPIFTVFKIIWLHNVQRMSFHGTSLNILFHAVCFSTWLKSF